MNDPTPSNVILIHGNGGATAQEHWLPQVATELTALGLKVVNETFPDNHQARAEFWLPHIENLGADHHTIIIGHSSGAVAAMRFAESHRLHGIILVGASHTDLDDEDEKASGYFNAPWKWDSIIANVDFVDVFASTDDPYIPLDHAEHISKMLDGKLHRFDDRGHFLENEFPELVEIVKQHLGLVE